MLKLVRIYKFFVLKFEFTNNKINCEIFFDEIFLSNFISYEYVLIKEPCFST